MRFHTARQRVQFVPAFQSRDDASVSTAVNLLAESARNPCVVCIHQIKTRHILCLVRVEPAEMNTSSGAKASSLAASGLYRFAKRLPLLPAGSGR